jgi:hypothetical protein
MQMAIINNQRWTFLERKGNQFEAVVRPEPGELKVGQKRGPQERMYQTILGYQVHP